MRAPDWWTPSDDEYLLDVFGAIPVAEIAGELGVDRKFVRDRAVWLRNEKDLHQKRKKEQRDV